MRGHIEGPWVAQHDEEDMQACASIWSGEGMKIAIVVGLAEFDYANARLIAAAPDLLAACKKALDFIEACVEPSCEEGDEIANGAIHEGNTEEGDALRAAIARAEGRTP